MLQQGIYSHDSIIVLRFTDALLLQVVLNLEEYIPEENYTHNNISFVLLNACAKS